MACENCNKNKPIVNKKYNLCDDCNFMRMHDGKTKAEVYTERMKSRMSKLYAPSAHAYDPSLVRTKIKQQTKKQAKRSEDLHVVKRDLELDEIQSGTYFCKGCGMSKPGLDKSHILSVGQRKDLELDKDNIRLHCRECHMDWESWDIVRMGRLHCFEDDLQYIYAHDSTTFSKIMTKIHEYIKWEPTENQLVRKLKTIVKNFENCC